MRYSCGTHARLAQTHEVLVPAAALSPLMTMYAARPGVLELARQNAALAPGKDHGAVQCSVVTHAC